MSRYRLASALIFNASVVLAAVACGEAADDTPGTGGGAGMASGATGGASASGGKSGAGGTGATAGSMGGSASGGMTTGGAGGTGGAMGGSAGSGSPVGGSGGMPAGAGGTPMAGSGSGAAGGAAGSGAGAGGSGTPTNCTITPTATQSEVIPTVFNVEFTTDFPAGYTARIEFGPDTAYGFSAPVDTAEPMNKTALLGMKPDKDYHYQVVLTGGGMECKGADQTVKTGLLENGLRKPMVQTPGAAGIAGGFLVGEWYAGDKKYAFILDKDNEFVWWFNPADVVASFDDVTRVRMSADSKYMYIGHGNVPSGTGRMVRVRMDGTGGEDLSNKFQRLNHDFVMAPAAGGGEDIYFIAYAASGQCDDIVQHSAAGMTSVVMNLGDVFSGACHANAIEYSAEDDTLIVSELDHNAYLKIKRTGERVWVLGGAGENDFTGGGATWQAEHNLHVLAADRILFFNNGSGSGSKAIELQLDLTAMTATNVWEYAAMPSIANAIMGDVQRLWNENTLVTYSTQGVIHEVDKNKMLLQSLKWDAGGALGYVIKRQSLYGPSPK